MTKRNVGWILVVIGLFMLFKMVRVSSFGFMRIGRMSTSAIVLVLLVLSGIAMVVNKNKFTSGCFYLALCFLVLSILLGTELHFAYVTLIDVLLVLIPIVVGTGMIIGRALTKKRSN